MTPAAFNPLLPEAPLPTEVGIFERSSPSPEFAPLDCRAPRLGFCSCLIHGTGEYILAVHPGTPAARIGLEPGDVIMALNGHRLTSKQAWSQAMAQATTTDGSLRLQVRDKRTGTVAHRSCCVFAPGRVRAGQ